MSCTKSDFAEIAQPRRRRDRGIGEHPNKQENVRPRESGSRAIFRKCIYTCIACRLPSRAAHRGMDLIADSPETAERQRRRARHRHEVEAR